MPTNVVATPSLAAEIRDFYDLTMLNKAIPELVYAKYAKKNKIPKNVGRTIHWRRSSLYVPNLTPLTESVTPVGDTMTVTDISVTVNQYGRYVAFSDEVTTVSIDDILTENAENLGQLAGNTADQITREALVVGTNVQYANGRVSRVTVAAGDIVTDTEIKKWVRNLSNANAKPVPGVGGFVAIVSPSTFMDLQGTNAFQNTGWYQDKERIYKGQVIYLYGVYFLETSNAKVFAGAGAAGIDVHATVIFGADAFATVDIQNLGLETIFKGLGSAGTMDPLNQQQTQGFKMTFACAILNQTWLLRAEHAVTA